MPTVVRLGAADRKTQVTAQNSYPQVVPESGRSSLICEVVTLSPEQHLPYVFELRKKEVLEFMLASNVPIDVLFCKMDDYDAWMEARRASLLGCMEAAEILVYAMSFTAPSEEPYAAVLINGSESPADIAVEIRLSLPEVLW